MSILSQPLAHIIVKFTIDGTTYDVETFKINFDQSTDFKGQPQHEIEGGQFMITLSHAVDNNLLLWAKKSTQVKNGEIVFQTDLGMTVYKIEFENAYCITLARNIDAMTGTKTSLMIAPEIITMNGVKHNNNWRK